MSDRPLSFDTQIIHAGVPSQTAPFATLAPVVQSAAHRFPTGESLSDAFSGKAPAPIYMRLKNPTNGSLEQKVAILEGAGGALAVASGMAAVSDAVLAACRAGDHIVAGRTLFMSTYLLFTSVIKKFGIEADLADPLKPEEFEAAIQPNTRLLYVETIGNPNLDVPDIKRLAQIAHGHGLPLFVDNTLATPWLYRPIEAGADVVVHSTTKFLNGHGSAVGGLVLDSGNFDWPSPRFDDMKPFKDRAGKLAFLDRVYREIHVNLGTSAAPWHSFLTLIGIDTLALRMERHCQNAMALAEHLAAHPKVTAVNYPGLTSSASYGIARDQFAGKGFGGLLTFDLETPEQCFDLIKNLALVYHLANLGDCKTLIIHPWSSQYVSFTGDKRHELGVRPAMLRVSVGIENIDDIKADFDQALGKI